MKRTEVKSLQQRGRLLVEKGWADSWWGGRDSVTTEECEGDGHPNLY